GGVLFSAGAVNGTLLAGAIMAAIARACVWVADRRSRRLCVGGESRAAIMFIDVRDFTLLTGRMQPREVFRVVNRLLDDVIPIIEREGGRVEKFLGDGIMASFGLDRRLENAALS